MGRGKKNVECVALYHQGHREYTNDIDRDEARGGF